MATKCEKMGVRISSLVDRELWEFEARSVRSHVEECATCAAVYRELRSARLMARSLPQCDPPSDLWPGVTTRLEEMDRRFQALREYGAPISRRGPSVTWLTGASFIAMLAIVSWLMMRFYGFPVTTQSGQNASGRVVSKSVKAPSLPPSAGHPEAVPVAVAGRKSVLASVSRKALEAPGTKPGSWEPSVQPPRQDK